jgi:hypothetical protein
MGIRTYAWLGLLLPLAVGAEIYRYVDEDGVVRYTDKPPHQDAKPVELPAVQTYTSDDGYVRDDADPAEEPGAVPEQAGYRGVQLISPAPDEVFQNADPQVTASAQVEPGLQPGHRLVFLVDGQSYPAAPGQSSLLLSGLARGSHTLQAVVMDASDRVQAESESRSFHLSPPSALQPSPINALPKLP